MSATRRRSRRGLRDLTMLGALAFSWSWAEPLAQGQPPAAPGSVALLSDALATTRAKGVATAIIFTSAEAPDSGKLAAAFLDGPWARSNRGLIQVLALAKDEDPELLESLGVTKFPTVAVYVKNPDGLELRGSLQDVETADKLGAWLDGLKLGTTPAPASSDPAVAPAMYGSEPYPSQQVPPPSMPTPPPQQPPAPPSYPQQPLYSAPPTQAYAPAAPVGLIQVPGQHFLIQQQAPQIYMAPAQPPMVYTTQPMMPAMAPAGFAPASNMFLPVAAPAPAPVAAAAVPAYAPAAAAPPLAAAPVAAGAANQVLSLPASRTSTKVRVRGPGLIGAGLSRLGERMIQFGRSSITTTQETTLDAPYIPPSGAGVTTISTTTPPPVFPQIPFSIAPPQVPVQQAPPASPPPPPPTTPSPQDQETKKHSWFHR